MLSHKLKSIYLHIPKTAGTSIEAAFGHHKKGRLNQDHRTVREVEPLAEVLRYFHRRDSFETLAKRVRNQARRFGGRYFETVTPLQYQSYFKFAIVRNPWDRCHSWYKNVMRNDWHRKQNRIDADCSFDTFMRLHKDQWGLRPQTYWLENSAGNIELDYIGRFEKLDEAFIYVCDKMEVGPIELPRMLVKHGRANYVDDYDDALIRHVEKLYAHEIELFDYKFGD